MSVELPAELPQLQEKTRTFIRDKIITMERDPRQDAHSPHETLRRDLVTLAREAGASKVMEGMGLSHIAKAVVFEEAGYSRLGPTALNIHAQGDIHLMEEVATAAQKKRWLRPQVQGHTIPSEEQYIRTYSQTTGRELQRECEFYMAYNLFRMAAILRGIGQRAVDGTAVSSDALENARRADPLAELGWQSALKYHLC